MKEATAALKLALEALEMHVPHVYTDRGYGPIIDIKEALAPTSTRCEVQPEQEPVALELEEYDAGLLNDYGGGNVEWWQDYIRAELGRAYEHYQSQTTTPPQRPWVGLMDEQIEDARIKVFIECGADLIPKIAVYFARVIEAKLKEKNT